MKNIAPVWEMLLAFVIVVLIMSAMTAAVWFVLPKVESVETYSLHGEVYECEHFDNGDMTCEQVGDPDIGGGRITP